MELANDTFSLHRFAFSCSYIIDGVVNSNSKLTKSSSVYPCEYKCMTAIFVNSERTIFCTLSINAFGTFNAAYILFFKYSTSSIPPNSIPLNESISVPLCPPLTGR